MARFWIGKLSFRGLVVGSSRRCCGFEHQLVGQAQVVQRQVAGVRIDADGILQNLESLKQLQYGERPKKMLNKFPAT